MLIVPRNFNNKKSPTHGRAHLGRIIRADQSKPITKAKMGGGERARISSPLCVVPRACVLCENTCVNVYTHTSIAPDMPDENKTESRPPFLFVFNACARFVHNRLYIRDFGRVLAHLLTILVASQRCRRRLLNHNDVSGFRCLSDAWNVHPIHLKCHKITTAHHRFTYYNVYKHIYIVEYGRSGTRPERVSLVGVHRLCLRGVCWHIRVSLATSAAAGTARALAYASRNARPHPTITTTANRRRFITCAVAPR